MSALLDLRHLAKHYGAIAVTDDVSLTVAEGQTVALIGPNGAGKTTLIRQIAGEISCDRGEIHFAGRRIDGLSVARRARAGIGRSYQITSIVAGLTVLENVVLAVQARQGSNLRFWRPALAQPALVGPAEACLARLGLLALSGRPAGELAYGQQRQLELAVAVAASPRLLLLDEPLAGLGMAESEAMLEVQGELRREHAILLVEHDMSAVFRLADRIDVLCYGRLIFSGTAEEVRASPAVRDAYLGDESMD